MLCLLTKNGVFCFRIRSRGRLALRQFNPAGTKLGY
jgi:hypothetical protein